MKLYLLALLTFSGAPRSFLTVAASGGGRRKRIWTLLLLIYPNLIYIILLELFSLSPPSTPGKAQNSHAKKLPISLGEKDGYHQKPVLQPDCFFRFQVIFVILISECRLVLCHFECCNNAEKLSFFHSAKTFDSGQSIYCARQQIEASARKQNMIFPTRKNHKPVSRVGSNRRIERSDSDFKCALKSHGVHSVH